MCGLYLDNFCTALTIGKPHLTILCRYLLTFNYFWLAISYLISLCLKPQSWSHFFMLYGSSSVEWRSRWRTTALIAILLTLLSWESTLPSCSNSWWPKVHGSSKPATSIPAAWCRCCRTPYSLLPGLAWSGLSLVTTTVPPPRHAVHQNGMGCHSRQSWVETPWQFYRLGKDIFTRIEIS